jgi:hypothetical protein
LIPSFEPDGLLPAGTHDCTLAEIRSKLVFTDRRDLLSQYLLRLFTVLPGRAAIDYLLVDGSFAESKPEPRDVDLGIVVKDLVHGGDSALVAEWIDSRYETLYKLWHLDVVVLDQAMVDEYWLRAYTHTRTDRVKGVLRVSMSGGSSP